MLYQNIFESKTIKTENESDDKVVYRTYLRWDNLICLMGIFKVCLKASKKAKSTHINDLDTGSVDFLKQILDMCCSKNKTKKSRVTGQDMWVHDFKTTYKMPMVINTMLLVINTTKTDD